MGALGARRYPAPHSSTPFREGARTPRDERRRRRPAPSRAPRRMLITRQSSRENRATWSTLDVVRGPERHTRATLLSTTPAPHVKFRTIPHSPLLESRPRITEISTTGHLLYMNSINPFMLYWTALFNIVTPREYSHHVLRKDSTEDDEREVSENSVPGTVASRRDQEYRTESRPSD